MPVFEPLAPINARVVVRLDEARGNPVSEREKRRQSVAPGDVEKTFREAFAEAYGGVGGALCPRWTQKEQGMAKAALCRAWDGSAEGLHDFVDWFVRDWSQTRKTLFDWMGKKGEPAPLLPTLKFLLTKSFRDILLPAWSTRNTRSWIDRLDDNRKRLYLDLTLKQGKSYDEAFLMMSDVRAEAKLEEKMRQTLAEAGRRERAGVSAYEAAKLVARNAGSIHRKSETARRQREAAALETLRSAPAENLNPVSNMADFTDLMNVKFRED